YQVGEVHRLRGEVEEAEAAYRRASRLGRRPEPGIALLRLAQGRTDAAVAIIRRATDETVEYFARPRMLGPLVEIMLAAGATDTARQAADELLRIADDVGAPLLNAIAARADGAVRL